METTAAAPGERPGEARSRVDRARLLANVRRSLFGETFGEVTVGRYVLGARLASGAMGQIHLAFDPQLKREVALKLLRWATSSEAEAIAREARAIAKLQLREVVRVFDVGQSEHGLFIAMERLHGQTLAQWIRASKPPLERRVEAVLQVARGLAGAHDAGLVHRDVKPANVVVERDGRVVLVDFGLAVDVGLDAPQTAEPIGGTPAYMAPEQHRGEKPSSAADQYAWAVMAWEALYGARPFVETAPAALLEEKLAFGRPPPTAAAKVPRAVHRVLLRGLAPHPAGRWPSMRDLLVALQEAQSGRRTRGLALAGLALLIASCGLATAYALLPPEPETLACVAPLRWDHARPQIQAAMLGDGEPWRREAWVRLADRLDGMAEDFASTRTTVCEDALDHDERSARLDCLRRWSAGFSGLVEALAALEEGEVASAVRWSLSLKPPTACTTPSTAYPQGPAAPARLARDVLDLRIRLARAGQLRSDGALGPAEKELYRLQSDAEALGFEPVLAEILCARARVLSYRDDPRSLPMFERAYALALRSRHDYFQAVAANRIAEVLTLSKGDIAGARTWLRRAKAAGTARWPKQEVRRLQGEALVALESGREDEAVGLQQQALTLAESTEEPLLILSITQRTASVLSNTGHTEEAYTAARKAVDAWAAIGEQTWGSLTELGTAAAKVGAYDEADRALSNALELIEGISGPHSANTALVQVSRADAYNLRAMWTQAAAALKAADAGLADTPQHPLWVTVEISRGETRLGQGRFDDAIAAFGRARVLAEGLWGERNGAAGWALAGQGRAMLASGDASDAEANLDAAWALLSEHRTSRPDPDWARLRFAMARAQAHSGGVGARDTAAEALRLAEAPDPVSTALHTRIERWLAERDG